MTIQLTTEYEYAVNGKLAKVRLPVTLVPPTKVDPNTTEAATDDAPKPLAELIASVGAAVEDWLTHYAPSPDSGEVLFDLRFMSNLTAQPMPLLRLRGLYLDVADVTPATQSAAE